MVLLAITCTLSSCSSNDGAEISATKSISNKSNRKSIELNETVTAKSKYGDVEISLDAVQYENEDMINGDRENGEISDEETILVVKYTAKNLSYYDEYNDGYVDFDNFIKLLYTDGTTVDASSSAREHGSYSSAAGAFAKLDRGEKKSIATEYIIKEGMKELVFYIGEDYEILVNLNNSNSDQQNKETTEAITSVVEITYTDATNATKADLTGSTGSWKYKGIPLLSEDCEWIDSSLNKNETVNQGAVYRKIAKVLDGSDFEEKHFLYHYSDFAPFIIGFVPKDVDEWAVYGKNASEFIVTKDQIKAIMKKFQSLETATGDYDFDYKKFGKYSVDIEDLTACAEEMKISEEMLGYIFAMLDEYATTITFNGNSCHIDYTSYS